MVRSTTQAWSKRTWMLSGLLAVLSGSLILAAGCASGGSDQPSFSGSAKVHTWNEAPADGCRGCPLLLQRDPRTMPAQRAWTSLGWSGAPQGPFRRNPPRPDRPRDGRTAPTFTLSIFESARSTRRSPATAEFYIVNNWDHAISNVTASLPPGDLLYELPTGEQILAATFQGTGNSMYDWLLAGGGLFKDKCAPEFFPSGENTSASQVSTRFSTSLAFAAPKDGSQDELLTTMTVIPPSDASIAAGSKSTNTGTVTLVFRGEGQSMARPVVALAFSTYFGVQLNFQY
jgi:hypothetical protein